MNGADNKLQIEASNIDVFNGTYLDWKDWSIDSFGSFTMEEAHYFRAEVKRAGVRTDRPLSVLDVGFGKGQFIAWAKSQGWQVIGSEISSALVQIAQAKGFEAYAAKDIPLDRQFDLIILFDVLEHVPGNGHLELLRDLYGRLAPGGVLIVKVPNGDSPLGLANQNGDVTHIESVGSGKLSYYAELLPDADVKVRGNVRNIRRGRLHHSIYELVTIPLRWIISTTFKVLYFPRSNIVYFSSNLVATFRKP